MLKIELPQETYYDFTSEFLTCLLVNKTSRRICVTMWPPCTRLLHLRGQALHPGDCHALPVRTHLQGVRELHVQHGLPAIRGQDQVPNTNILEKRVF